MKTQGFDPAAGKDFSVRVFTKRCAFKTIVCDSPSLSCDHGEIQCERLVFGSGPYCGKHRGEEA